MNPKSPKYKGKFKMAIAQKFAQTKSSLKPRGRYNLPYNMSGELLEECWGHLDLFVRNYAEVFSPKKKCISQLYMKKKQR
jgi:hypothetical protein